MTDRRIAWCVGLAIGVVAFGVLVAVANAGVWDPKYGAEFGLPIVLGWATGRIIMEYRRRHRHA